MAGEFQRRIVTADCEVINRFAMPFPVEMPVGGCFIRRDIAFFG
jgi:hypothetical protein